MFGNGKIRVSADDHPNLRAFLSLRHEAEAQLALVAIALLGLSWTFFDEGLGALAVPAVLLLWACWRVATDIDRKSAATRILTPPHEAFVPFWHGSKTSRLSQLAYKRFLSSFGKAAHSLGKETTERVLDETYKAATGSSLSLECPVDEGNWKAVARYLKGLGAQANLEAVAAGVPIEDVFA